MTDYQLVNNFLKNRDDKSFHKLYTSMTPHLYKMAFRLTDSESLCDDLIQDMWVVAIKKLGDFQWRSELKTWLIGILINLSRNNRKEKEKWEITQLDSLVPEISIESKFLETYDLELAISKLPPGYRQILILHDIEGFKHREIAELLDIKEGTCKSQLFYARKALRKLLGEKFNKNIDHG